MKTRFGGFFLPVNWSSSAGEWRKQADEKEQHRATLGRMLADRENNRPIEPQQVRYLDYAAKQAIKDRGEPALDEMLRQLAQEQELQRSRNSDRGGRER
jgi:hypothetical protein